MLMKTVFFLKKNTVLQYTSHTPLNLYRMCAAGAKFLLVRSENSFRKVCRRRQNGQKSSHFIAKILVPYGKSCKFSCSYGKSLAETPPTYPPSWQGSPKTSGTVHLLPIRPMLQRFNSGKLNLQ